MQGATRRELLLGLGAAGTCLIGHATRARAVPGQAPLALSIAVKSPWMASQVALTSDEMMFLGLPRYSRDHPIPSLVRREPDGSLRPFPDNGWNDWAPGKDGREAFVYINAVHIFADDTVWCIDQGAPSEGVFPGHGTPEPGAQKIVQLDPRTGSILRILRFDDDILPPGGKLNDLRRHGDLLYITDSGLGGIIVHDLASGRSSRRLSGHAVVKSTPGHVPAVLAHVQGKKPFHPPESDLIEITDDGRWLYWASPTGPLRRIETRYLLDSDMRDEILSEHVEHVFDNNFAGGCAMDTAGNFYFCETETGCVTLLAPDGRTSTLLQDPDLLRPDGGFISNDRCLYLPVKKPLQGADGLTFHAIYVVALPDSISGIPLGSAVTGISPRI